MSAFIKGEKVSFPEKGEGKLIEMSGDTDLPDHACEDFGESDPRLMDTMNLTKVEPQANASERKLSRKTDPEEFKKFHALLTRDRPDFQPFYFPLRAYPINRRTITP